MSLVFLLDEDVSYRVAVGLRARDINAVSVHEIGRADLEIADEEQLVLTTEFLQRQIERLPAEAAHALTHAHWDTVRQRATTILRLQPDNQDAAALLNAAGPEPTQASTEPPADPTSFANGRYQVKKFLGEENAASLERALKHKGLFGA